MDLLAHEIAVQEHLLVEFRGRSDALDFCGERNDGFLERQAVRVSQCIVRLADNQLPDTLHNVLHLPKRTLSGLDKRETILCRADCLRKASYLGT